jgi:hypothetical protein
MNYNLILDNNLTYYGIIISSGVILGCTLIFLIKSNYTAIPPQNLEAITNKNIEAFTYEEIEAIVNENAVTITNIEAITDSDSDTDVESDCHSTFNSDSSSDTESILNDPDLFFMPNVDLDVCPIEELKFFEFSSLYHREIIEHSITDEDIMEFISWFSKEDLLTNGINDLFLFCISII